MQSAWEIASDADEVHRLLLASDAAASGGGPVPDRRIEGTRRRLADGVVHLLRIDGRAAAMVTVTPAPPFDLADTEYANLPGALYMQRLAVDPDLAADYPHLGMRAVRHALDIAVRADAPALRAEANPDLTRVLALLLAHGFEPVGARRGPPDRPRIYLELGLTRQGR